MNYSEEMKALYLLNNMKGMLSDKLLQIYEYFGSYEEAYRQSADVYFEAGIFRQEKMRDHYMQLKDAEKKLLLKLETLEEGGVRLVGMMDEAYPKRLCHIEDRPPLLYVCGKLPEEERHTAGIIGSRKCSEYGRSVAAFFAGELARRGVQIVSGLAYGIDGAAAKGSLEAARESYGILGCGVNVCYPRENWPLYSRMKAGEGGLISEFPPDAGALGYHFVLRNRIISGLSDVLMVIEAGEKSGTATTVEFALDQGKEVFALPGRITDPLGFGCNRMLKDGAAILTSPSDVLEYFGMEEEKLIKMEEKDLSHLSEKEKLVYSTLGLESQHVESIMVKCGLSLGIVLTVLAALEAKGYVTSPSGAYYRRKA